jgi:hypothetical protein
MKSRVENDNTFGVPPNEKKYALVANLQTVRKIRRDVYYLDIQSLSYTIGCYILSFTKLSYAIGCYILSFTKLCARGTTALLMTYLSARTKNLDWVWQPSLCSVEVTRQDSHIYT